MVNKIADFALWLRSNQRIVLEVLTCILAFSVPFPKGFSAYTVGTWFGMALLLSLGHWRSNVVAAVGRRSTWPSVLLLALFACGMFSMAYAADSHLVTHRLFNARFTLFCIPLGVLIANIQVPLSRLLKSYVFGVAAFVLYSYLAVAFMMHGNYFLEAFSGDTWAGLTHLFGAITNRAYTNTGVVLAIVSIGYLAQKQHISRPFFWVYAFILLLFLSFLFINTSRMVLASAFVVAGAAVVSFVTTNRKAFLIGLFSTVAVGCLVFFTDNRVSQSLHLLYQSFHDGSVSFSDPRFNIWKACLSINPHTYLYGFGENNVDAFLFTEYARMGWAEGVAEQYGCHNQYVELFLELGLPGLLLFVASLVVAPFCVEGKKKRFVALFVTMFALVMLTESYVSRAAGALLFAFFMSVVCVAGGDAKPSYAVPSVLVPLKRWIGPVLVLGSLIAGVCFGICYSNKTSEVYSLAKANDIRLKGNEYNGNPIYKLDANSRVSAGDSNAYSYYVFFISRNQIQNVRFEIDCLVSEDFNGDWAIIANLDKNHVMKDACYYDMKRKGTWQTLVLNLPAGENFVNLDICKVGADNFSDLLGHVWYSNPRWAVIP